MKAERRTRGEKGSVNAIKIHYTHVWSYNEHLVLECKFYVVNLLLVITWKKNKFSVQRNLSWIADFKIVWSKTAPRQNVLETDEQLSKAVAGIFQSVCPPSSKGSTLLWIGVPDKSIAFVWKNSFIRKHCWHALHAHCHQGSLSVSKWVRRSVELPAASGLAPESLSDHGGQVRVSGHHCHVKIACLVQQQAGTPWVGSVVTPKDNSPLPGWCASLENERSAFPGKWLIHCQQCVPEPLLEGNTSLC